MTAQGVQTGTSVWVDGVQVGKVESVHLNPAVRDRPIEVLMELETPYDLGIPRDSISRLASQGVLGPSVINIDTRMATGSRVENNGVLKSQEAAVSDQGADVMENVGNALVNESKKLRQQQKVPTTPATQ